MRTSTGQVAPRLSASRIALFGGSFDPPHLGHIAIARAAADHFALSQILFAPAARQPLKPDGASASFTDRLAMTALCCNVDPRFVASEIDGPRPGAVPNYTADTLERLHALQPDSELFILAGVDSFLTLAHWHEPQRLLALAQWIVVSRPGFPLGAVAPHPDGMTLSHIQRQRVHTLGTVHEEVSATRLRERLQLGEPCDDLLPPTVAAYIAQHSLYAGVP